MSGRVDAEDNGGFRSGHASLVAPWSATAQRITRLAPYISGAWATPVWRPAHTRRTAQRSLL